MPGTTVKSYVALAILVVALAGVALLADFGNDRHVWNRETDGKTIESALDSAVTTATVYEILKRVKDPELGITIVDLGLILDVGVEDKTIAIDMILTTPYCPYAKDIIADIRKKLFQYDGISKVRVNGKIRAGLVV